MIALITPCSLGFTVGAFPLYIPVREEPCACTTIKLLRFCGPDIPLAIEVEEKLLRGTIMLRNGGSGKDIVTDSLVRNGEICGTAIMAENLLKLEIGASEGKNCWKNDKEKIINTLNVTLRKARQLSYSKGPLIFVKIDRKYFALQ